MKAVTRRRESSQWQPQPSEDRQQSTGCPKGAAGIDAAAVLKDGVHRSILDGFQNKPNAAKRG